MSKLGPKHRETGRETQNSGIHALCLNCTETCKQQKTIKIIKCDKFKEVAKCQ
jgi:hypothetical protein